MTEENTPDRRIDDKRAEAQLEWQEAVGTAGIGEIAHDVMVDIETVGTAPGCGVLSIGAVTFGPDGLGHRFYINASLASSTALGLTIDPDTITWWLNQSRDSQDAAFQSDAPALLDALMMFSDWYLSIGPERVWCHGATFDVPVLDAAYRAARMSPPWQYWQVRCTRTLYDLAGVKVDRSKGTHHNALDDAINQAEAAVRALRIMKLNVPAIAEENN